MDRDVDMNQLEQTEKRKQHFEALRAWDPVKRVMRCEELFDLRDPYYSLCEYLYVRCKDLYAQMPLRKNGFDSFLHPINVLINMKRSGITDCESLLCALLHDYIEEQVDLYKDAQGMNEDDLYSRQLLDEYEVGLVASFEKELHEFCQKEAIDGTIVGQIIETIKLLTRLKRDYYYKSISYIFGCKDPVIRERAIQVKLADRIHNIMSIECFDERGRLYQCFKNLFIINSAKQFLIETYGAKVFDWRYSEKAKATERLFTRCCKATYEAYLVICTLTSKKEIYHVKPLLQLAFKKFKLEHAGIWAITDFEDETHPMRLYQGVIRKWDARLHHEWDEWKLRVADEKQFVEEFFSEYGLTDEQVQAVIDYKDAYALKEVIAILLYDQDYVLSSFLSRQLDTKGRLKVVNGNK